MATKRFVAQLPSQLKGKVSRGRKLITPALKAELERNSKASTGKEFLDLRRNIPYSEFHRLKKQATSLGLALHLVQRESEKRVSAAGNEYYQVTGDLFVSLADTEA